MNSFLTLHGVSKTLQWITWFAKALAVNLIAITMFSILLTPFQNTFTRTTQSTVLYQSNPVVLWFFLLFSIFAMITFSFFMSLFFKKAKVSVIAAILIYMLVNIVFFIWEKHDYDLWKSFNSTNLFFACIFPSLAIDIGSAVIVSLEFKGVGLTWSSLFTSDETYGLSVADVMMGMLISALIFSILICYIELLYSDLSKRKKWYYPFQYVYNYIAKKEWQCKDEISVFDHGWFLSQKFETLCVERCLDWLLFGTFPHSKNIY
jgi:hypothetical protein